MKYYQKEIKWVIKYFNDVNKNIMVNCETSSISQRNNYIKGISQDKLELIIASKEESKSCCLIGKTGKVNSFRTFILKRTGRLKRRVNFTAQSDCRITTTYADEEGEKLKLSQKKIISDNITIQAEFISHKRQIIDN